MYASYYLTRQSFNAAKDKHSRYALQESSPPQASPDLAIIVSDGLSALTVERQSQPLLDSLLPRLAGGGWRIAPIVIAR